MSTENLKGEADIDTVVIPRQLYENMLETIETLSDKAEIEGIKRGIEDIRNGRVLSESEFLEAHKDLL